MVTKRANRQTISFLRRNLSSCPKDIKEASYKTGPCPTSSRICIRSLGSIDERRRNALRDSAKMTTATSMIQNLGWDDLQHRREQCNTVVLYRIVNNLVDIPAHKYLIHSGTATRGHGTRFLVPYCSVFFLPLNDTPLERPASIRSNSANA